jgi:hypothetical protein
MKKLFGKAMTIVFILSLAVYGSARAAYIDPNTGGILFQLLAVMIGVISGFLLLFSSQVKKVFYKIKRSLRGDKDEQSDDNGSKDQS